MSNIYREFSEQNTVKGVEISKLRVKYPIDEVIGRSDGFFEMAAKRFSERVRNDMFKVDAERFSEHVESGGRRSAFPKRVYSLVISACGERDGSVSIKTEASVSESLGAIGARIIAYSVDHTVWDRKNGALCDERALKLGKKRAHDGFFVDKNGVFYFDIDNEKAALPKNTGEIGGVLRVSPAK